MEDIRILAAQVDDTRVRCQEAPRTLSDHLQHRPDLEGGGDLATNIGQRGHLVGALPRFVVEASVLNRDSDIGGDRREQPRIGLAEAPFFLDALHADCADRLVAHQDWDAQIGSRPRTDQRHSQAVEVRVAVHEDRFAVPDDPRGNPLPKRNGIRWR